MHWDLKFPRCAAQGMLDFTKGGAGNSALNSRNSPLRGARDNAVSNGGRGNAEANNSGSLPRRTKIKLQGSGIRNRKRGSKIKSGSGIGDCNPDPGSVRSGIGNHTRKQAQWTMYQNPNITHPDQVRSGIKKRWSGDPGSGIKNKVNIGNRDQGP